jgi:hypothetical protein
MQRRNDLYLFLGLIGWFALVAVGVVIAAHGAGEPPFWDALSYVEKSKRFWDNVAAGIWENPLDILPTIRPPGVIAVAFPFGFSYNYHRFYARMILAPIALLAVAVMVAGWEPQKSAAFKKALMAAVLVLAGMPFLYQFQPNDILRTQSNWGLVDGLLAGVAALATAAGVRSVRLRSIPWAVLAALVAAYGLYVKPAGLIVMGLVGATWLLMAAESIGWSIKRAWEDKRFLVYVLVGLVIAAGVYFKAVDTAFNSAYYSQENIEFGLRNLRIFREEVVYAVDLPLLADLLRCSCGWLVLVSIVTGLTAAVKTRTHLAAAAMAALTLVVGVWFWIFTTNIGDVRYFMPFVTIAFMLTMPAVLSLADRVTLRTVTGATILAGLPAVLVTAMMLMPAPPVWLQSRLGVNLFNNYYGPENEQARRLLVELEQAKRPLSQVYIFDVSSVTRNFGAVVDYHNSIIHHEPYLRTMLPVNWQRGLAYRFDEMVQSDFLAFQPITDPTKCASILAKQTIDDYPDQSLHVNAWATTIGPNEGVELMSETRLRLMRVTDPAKLAASLKQFAVQYTWPKPFRDNNNPDWWARPAQE